MPAMTATATTMAMIRPIHLFFPLFFLPMGALRAGAAPGAGGSRTGVPWVCISAMILPPLCSVTLSTPLYRPTRGETTTKL